MLSCDMHHLRFGLSKRLVGGSKDDTVVFLMLYVDRTKLGAHNLQFFFVLLQIFIHLLEVAYRYRLENNKGM